jgi:protein-tyrosine-phosphatase
MDRKSQVTDAAIGAALNFKVISRGLDQVTVVVVTFVCPFGTVKSAIAREQLKHSAAARGLAVQVLSRGVHPADQLTPNLTAQLAADGIDPGAEPLRALASDIAHADVVVAFDEAAQAPGMEKARVWDVPSWNEDYSGARAALMPNIHALLDELGKRPC